MDNSMEYIMPEFPCRNQQSKTRGEFALADLTSLRAGTVFASVRRRHLSWLLTLFRSVVGKNDCWFAVSFLILCGS